MPPTVLLVNTNWWPCASHLAISMTRAGCRVAAAYPPKGHPLAKTTAVWKRFPYRPLAPLESLSRAIIESAPDLIVPCDDRTVGHLHQLHDRAVAHPNHQQRNPALAALIERSLGSPVSYPVVSSRFALLSAAREEMLAVPDAAPMAHVADLARWAVNHPLPWVMKADRSWGGLGVKIVASLDEAEACFEKMRKPLRAIPMLKRVIVNRDLFWYESWRRKWTPSICVQSFIAGRPANCSVFCWQGRVLAGISVHVVAAQGAIGPATVVRIVDEHQMLHCAKVVAGRLNLSGFYGFDFMIEDQTGSAILIELNPRCTMPCHLRLPHGRDLVGSLHRALSGVEPEQPPSALPTSLVSYFPQAWLSDPESESLYRGYHDVPWREPALVKELMLLPWPDRSLLARYSEKFRNRTFERGNARRYARHHVFLSHDYLSNGEQAHPQESPDRKAFR